MKNKLDHEKIKIAIAIALWSAIGSYVSRPLIHNNQEAINIIVTVFSVLAGFLIAVITLVGDPKSLPSGGWQKAQLGSELTSNRLVRHKWLFTVYLISLVLIFLSMLLKNRFLMVQIIIEYTYLFFSFTAFILSFRLPSSLMQLQEERIEQEIEERRRLEGISDEP
jgi:hypothetical protein